MIITVCLGKYNKKYNFAHKCDYESEYSYH